MKKDENPELNSGSSTKKLSLMYIKELNRAKCSNVTIPYAEGFYKITKILKAVEHENWRELRVNAEWCPLNWNGGYTLSITANLSPLFSSASSGDKELGLDEYLHLILKIENCQVKENIYSGKNQLRCDWKVFGEMPEDEIESLNKYLAEKASNSDKKEFPKALSQEFPRVLPVKSKSLAKKSPEEISKVLPEELPEKLSLGLPKEAVSDQEVKLSKENVKLDRKSLKLKNAKIFIEDEADSLESDNSDYADFMKQKPNLDNL